MTQEELGDLAEIDPKHIQELEHGRTNPTLATLVAVAKGLRVGIEQLFSAK